ncbi:MULTISPECIES: immunoglobulin I-set domain protein [unclassified Streptomyces]|uniref:immunoglobulin I-set domain protein n=1 Tax=unclassified Streptomyces TaxID=2593676 RepID=UPI003811F55B
MTDATKGRPGPVGAARPRGRRPAALLGAAALLAAATVAVTGGTAAQAADTPRTGLGKAGQKLTVSATAHLDPDGETLRVKGSGYDATKAIYVALCKDNGDGVIPTPCIGGADQNGTGSSSQWIVPEGDEYAGDLAVKWGAGGTFDVELDVKAKDGSVDCAKVGCSVVTRVDHRRPGDRSQDVRVPVAFEGQDPGDGDDGGDGVDVPPGTVDWVRAADFTTAGKVRDLLLHPDSGKLYAGSDDVVDTGDVNERGLYALDPADGRVRSHLAKLPGSNGALLERTVNLIAGPLPGDGVTFQYPLRGLATAKDGDTAAASAVWLTGATVTGVGPGTTAATTLVAQGATLSELDTATGAVRRTITLDGGSQLGVDPARRAAWSAGVSGGQLRRVDTSGTDAFTVTATAQLPDEGVGFVEADPVTGNVWVGSGSSVLVLDAAAKLLTTITGPDEAVDVAFDVVTKRAFVVWQDSGDTGNGGDEVSSLGVYDTVGFAAAAKPTTLAGNQSQLGEAAVAVAPGGTSVYVSSPAQARITKLDLRRSPRVTQSPTDRTVAPGDEVALVAAAEGTPEPTVAWSVSADGGQTWTPVEGATKNAYTFTARAAQDGYRYRAEFTNTAGRTRTTPVTLTVKEAGGDNGGGNGGNGGQTPTGPSGTKTVTGTGGQKLTVTPVNGLAEENQVLKVTGSGYDEKKGIYVALCVDNGPGELPTPCVGGVDMTGGSHSSAWISSNPPDYGKELAKPYGKGGSFAVELTVDAKDEFTDCFKKTCVLATRADHTLSGDRSQDVKVPVSFTGQPPVGTDDGPGADSGGTTGGAGGTSGGGTTGGTDGGTGTTGGTTTGGGSDGGYGDTGTTGGVSATGGTGGSLAATGVTVGVAAASAALLTAAGWYLRRRANQATARVPARDTAA